MKVVKDKPVVKDPSKVVVAVGGAKEPKIKEYEIGSLEEYKKLIRKLGGKI